MSDTSPYYKGSCAMLLGYTSQANYVIVSAINIIIELSRHTDYIQSNDLI